MRLCEVNAISISKYKKPDFLRKSSPLSLHKKRIEFFFLLRAQRGLISASAAQDEEWSNRTWPWIKSWSERLSAAPHFEGGCYYLVHIHNPTSALHFIDTIHCSDVPCGNLWHVTCQSDNDSGLLWYVDSFVASDMYSCTSVNYYWAALPTEIMLLTVYLSLPYIFEQTNTWGQSSHIAD